MILGSKFGLQQALNRGWNVLSSNFLRDERLREHNEVLEKYNRKDINWRIANLFLFHKKIIFKTMEFLRKVLFFCLNQIYQKLKKANRLDILKNPKDKKEKINLKALMKELVIYGVRKLKTNLRIKIKI